MIQDIAPAVFDGRYGEKNVTPASGVFCFRKGDVLLCFDQTIPKQEQLSGWASDYIYLFAIDGKDYFLCTPGESAPPTDLVWRNRRELRRLTPMDQTLAGFTAWHLAHWYRDNRFCGRCGSVMRRERRERKLICPDCGCRVYPRINPSVIISVYDGNRLLMARYANRPINWYVLLAGFIEVGETAEQCVAREVWEEVGLRVKSIRYYGSQPWGLTGGLSLAYTAELDGADTLRVDREELAEARWFDRTEVPVNKRDQASITQDMVRAFAEGRF